MKIHSKRWDKIRSIESRITYARVWFNIVDKVWAVSYYDCNAGDWIENNGYILDNFETKKEAIEWCKRYRKPFEVETMNGDKITSYEPYLDNFKTSTQPYMVLTDAN